MLQHINLPVLAIITVLVVAGLFFGNNYYSQYQVNMVMQLLEENLHIEEWKMENRGNKAVIYIRPAPLLDLPVFWSDLEHNIGEAYRGEVILKPLNSEASFLAGIYSEMSFVIIEGLEKGNLMDMRNVLRSIAKEYALDSFQLSIDQNYLYLEMSKGEEQFIQILPRQLLSVQEKGSDALW